MIAFITHPYHRGGVTEWMKNAFVYLSGVGMESFCITTVPEKPIFQGSSPLFYNILKGSTAHGLLGRRVGPLFELGNIASKADEYRQAIVANIPLGYTLIPSDDEACWMGCCQLADSYKVVVVIHSHGDEFYYELLKKYQKSITGIVCVSKRIYDKVVLKVPSFNRHQITIIPCGIPVQEYYSVEKKADSIVWLGRLEEESKRVSDIPKIASSLRDVGIDFHLDVIGDGPEYDRLSISLEQHNLFRHVTLRGWLAHDAVKSALSKAQILLQTSNYEGMSIAVMEALASGCHVVSTQVSGAEDINSPNVNLYPTGRIDAAVSAIASVFANVFDSKEPKCLAKTTFSIDICMRSYLNFISDLQFAKKHTGSFDFVLAYWGKLIAILRRLKQIISR